MSLESCAEKSHINIQFNYFFLLLLLLIINQDWVIFCLFFACNYYCDLCGCLAVLSLKEIITISFGKIIFVNTIRFQHK